MTCSLLSQKYRHVDNIMFENHTIADRFLDFWRKTGSQRMGYLYGRFTEHKDIPLGIRAEVAAIYEPPQVTASSYRPSSLSASVVFQLGGASCVSECHSELPGADRRPESSCCG